MEAMACGMPAIIMNTGGAENIIKGNGFVLNKLTIEILTEKINYFIKNREEIMKMGRRSRDIAESFSWENTAKQYSKIYNDMVSLTGG
jgi:Glycosyltransferase